MQGFQSSLHICGCVIAVCWSTNDKRTSTDDQKEDAHPESEQELARDLKRVCFLDGNIGRKEDMSRR